MTRQLHPPAGVLEGRAADRVEHAARAGASPGSGDVVATGRPDRVAVAVAGQPAIVPRRALRVGRFVRRPAVAALVVTAVVTGASAAAAGDWLEIFRTEQVAPVPFGSVDLIGLPDLRGYGDVVGTIDVEPHSVRDAAAAAAATGLDVPEVADLPRGVRGEPVYQVVGPVRAAFTFSAARAAATAAAAGATPAPPPPGLDGSEVRLVAGPGVAAVWSQGTGLPSLVVARAVAPTASSSGVSFETVRDHLLAAPGLADDVAAQLRRLTADGATLPLPVPAAEMTTSSARVHGVPATVLATRDRTVAAVVWVDDGIVTAVAGTLDADEVLAIARGLR